jgi:hypothetical protein
MALDEGARSDAALELNRVALGIGVSAAVSAVQALLAALP